ncbi:hypothetical protein ACLMAB_05480 [Brevibacillus laterosporus]
MSSTLSTTTTFIKGFTDILNSGTTLNSLLIGVVGGLAAVAIGAKTTSTSLLATSGAFGIATTATRAFTFALMSNPIGIAVAGITALTTALVYFTGKQKEAREETEQFNNSLIENYGTQKKRIDSLVDDYTRLSKVYENSKINSGTTNEKEKEYLQIQNDLGTLLPALIDHYDAAGKARLKSAEAVKEEIESVKELSILKGREDVAKYSVDTSNLLPKISETEMWVRETQKGIDIIQEKLKDSSDFTIALSSFVASATKLCLNPLNISKCNSTVE